MGIIGGGLDDSAFSKAYIQQWKPQCDPVHGCVSAPELAFRSKNLLVEEGDANIALSGQKINVKAATLRINDQALELTGQVTGLHEPEGQFHLKSNKLNLDRLLPSDKASGAPATPSAIETSAPDKPGSTQPGTEIIREARRSDLLHLARQASINVLAESVQGRYRKRCFEIYGSGLITIAG